MGDLARRLSATLNALLSLRQMSQSELAQRARMTPSQVSEYLSGSKLPKLPQLERLARALDVDLLTVFYTLSRIDDVRQRVESDPDELRDRTGDVILLREGGMLVKHPLSEVVDSINRLHDYIRELQLALAVRREGKKEP
jgi:transcriptional regulator with XRE-family HTH domain